MLKQRQELLNFALQLAKAAAEQIMPHYHNCVVNTKPDGTEVTEGDLRALR
jgi:3'-phosphoadenosine 5'-phosphosulfate (PAPS) 3'-phosphatase